MHLVKPGHDLHETGKSRRGQNRNMGIGKAGTKACIGIETLHHIAECSMLDHQNLLPFSHRHFALFVCFRGPKSMDDIHPGYDIPYRRVEAMEKIVY